MMTVKDLKEMLTKFPDNLPVFVSGYETGYANIQKVKDTRVTLNKNTQDWEGPFEEEENSDVRAIVIQREGR